MRVSVGETRKDGRELELMTHQDDVLALEVDMSRMTRVLAKGRDVVVGFGKPITRTLVRPALKARAEAESPHECSVCRSGTC